VIAVAAVKRQTRVARERVPPSDSDRHHGAADGASRMAAITSVSRHMPGGVGPCCSTTKSHSPPLIRASASDGPVVWSTTAMFVRATMSTSSSRPSAAEIRRTISGRSLEYVRLLPMNRIECTGSAGGAVLLEQVSPAVASATAARARLVRARREGMDRDRRSRGRQEADDRVAPACTPVTCNVMHAPKMARHLDRVPSAVHLVDENAEVSGA
jgi:hypothetical protein